RPVPVLEVKDDPSGGLTLLRTGDDSGDGPAQSGRPRQPITTAAAPWVGAEVPALDLPGQGGLSRPAPAQSLRESLPVGVERTPPRGGVRARPRGPHPHAVDLAEGQRARR